MPRSDDAPPPAARASSAPVSRRKFLSQVAAVAATAPALSALAADAAGAAARDSHRPRKHAPAPPAAKPAAEAPPASSGARPDWSVARTPAEREALEKQWKQMVELVAALRKQAVPVGAEFATGALAPRRLRREAN
jgi:2-oxoglutarate dehydrogenase E1 component